MSVLVPVRFPSATCLRARWFDVSSRAIAKATVSEEGVHIALRGGHRGMPSNAHDSKGIGAVFSQPG